MTVKRFDGPVQQVETDALVVVGLEEKPPAIEEDRIAEVRSCGEFNGKSLEVTVLHRPAGFKARRLVLAGGGKADKFNSAEMRKTMAVTLRALKPKGIRSIAVALQGEQRSDDFASAAVEGALLGDFDPDHYKTDPKDKEKHVDELVICGGSEAAVRWGHVLGESQNFTRALANEPPNV